MTTHQARAFIEAQRAAYQEDGITGATQRQHARMAALDVVPADRKQHALDAIAVVNHAHGRPPAGDSGYMRVFNMNTGELELRVRAPQPRLDVELDEKIDELATAEL